jgi:iron(III) transport system ATP-binding protein
MPKIVLTGVSKTYGSGAPAVNDIDLEIPDGSFTCLLGPSGCGKTTTLRMIAGLEHLTAGSIEVGDTTLDSVERGVFVPPERRGMGLVFQNYALWPHLTVAKNVEFGLRVRKVRPAERAERAREALRMMQIDWAGDRYPAQLSGGQQQRVSLARMLAVNPDVLLLDEPLSNLDAQLRLEMRAELKRIHEDTGHTIVFVTHDQMEVYNRPANTFVARFVGSPPMNLLGADDELTASAHKRLAALRPTGSDGPATVGVRPESIRLVDPGQEPGERDWSFDATVSAVLPTGSSWTVSVAAGATEIYLVSYAEVSVEPGAAVRCAVRAADLHLFDGDGNRLAAGPPAPNDKEKTAQWVS